VLLSSLQVVRGSSVAKTATPDFVSLGEKKNRWYGLDRLYQVLANEKPAMNEGGTGANPFMGIRGVHGIDLY